MTRFLEKVKLLNVALTGNPINLGAMATNVFVKSFDELDDEDIPEIEEINDFMPKGKAKDNRPPKQWWENCTRKAKKFADSPDKFCGALWTNPGQFGGGSKMRTVFGGKSLEIMLKGENMSEEEKQDKNSESQTTDDVNSNKSSENPESTEKTEVKANMKSIETSLKSLTENVEEIKKNTEAKSKKIEEIEKTVTGLKSEIKSLLEQADYKSQIAKNGSDKADLKSNEKTAETMPLDAI